MTSKTTTELNLCSKIKSIIDFAGKDITTSMTFTIVSYNLHDNIELRYIDKTLLCERSITFYIKICSKTVFCECHTYYDDTRKPASITNNWNDDLISEDEKQKLIKLIYKKYNEFKQKEGESRLRWEQTKKLDQELTKECISKAINRYYNESVL